LTNLGKSWIISETSVNWLGGAINIGPYGLISTKVNQDYPRLTEIGESLP
jgi:hypothetical protein